MNMCDKNDGTRTMSGTGTMSDTCAYTLKRVFQYKDKRVFADDNYISSDSILDFPWSRLSEGPGYISWGYSRTCGVFL